MVVGLLTVDGRLVLKRIERIENGRARFIAECGMPLEGRAGANLEIRVLEHVAYPLERVHLFDGAQGQGGRG